MADTLGWLQSKGLFENLHIINPSKNHKVQYHPRKIGKAGRKTIGVCRDGQYLPLCVDCGDFHVGICQE